MPNLERAVAIAVLVVLGTGCSSESKQPDAREAFPQALRQLTHWYEGGTLQQSTAAHWRVAKFENKLATAADWLSASVWKDSLRTPEDYDRLRPAARQLVDALDREVERTGSDDAPLAEIARTLIVGGEFDPR